MSKDTIYQDPHPPSDFTFNARVAEVFDDMLQRSVPCYQQVIDMTATLLARFAADGDRIYDLGCSTGTTLLHLARRLEAKELQFTGIDSSRAMIDKAVLKAEMLATQNTIRFVQGDIAEIELEPCGACILNYTLQFIRPMARKKFLTRLHSALKPGGILIISEKIISHDLLLNRTFIDLYHDFKRGQGYTETEIARKREALENILIPFSIQENIALLKKAGFSHVETFFQWFNFASFMAVKD
ncbi:MAG: carboxy-S-adenosyl-L-methionine synthase CmoA [Deltaproteobacteria bacterium]|nr:carboxy-S-adenosyl-L-methionine synthase CmoA [Deltaproteobacteria bacterium]